MVMVVPVPALVAPAIGITLFDGGFGRLDIALLDGGFSRFNIALVMATTVRAAMMVPVPVITVVAVLVASVVMIIPVPTGVAAAIGITFFDGGSSNRLDIALVSSVTTVTRATVMVPIPVVIMIAVLVASMVMVIPVPTLMAATVGITLFNSAFSRFGIALLDGSSGSVTFDVAFVVATVTTVLAAAMIPVPVVVVIALLVAFMVVIIPVPAPGATTVGIAFFNSSASRESVVFGIPLMVASMAVVALAAVMIPVPIVVVIAMLVASTMMTVPEVAVVTTVACIYIAGRLRSGSRWFRRWRSDDESQQACCHRNQRSNLHRKSKSRCCSSEVVRS
jgi:hypothetical protein